MGDPAWSAVWEYFERHDVDAILSGDADTGGDPRLDKAVRLMGRKSRAALLLAERLMDHGAKRPLVEGLGLELEALAEVFGHPDALEGLSALIEGRRPSFT